MALRRYSDEVKAKLKKAYIENNLAQEDLADASEEICGQAVDYETIHHWSRTDQWEIARSLFQATGSDEVPDTVEEEAAVMRELVSKKIFTEFSGLSPRDLTALVSAYNSLLGIGKFRTNSPKSDVQKVLEEIQKGELGNDV